MVDEDVVHERLHARFAPGWPAWAAVPDSWLPHLAELDEQLAAIDPGYQLAQVKVKFGGLRYYIQEPFQLPCCAAWDAAHPLADDADDETDEAWNAAADAHHDSAEHVAIASAREAVVERMEALIRAAEAASYTW